MYILLFFFLTLWTNLEEGCVIEIRRFFGLDIPSTMC